MGNETSRNKGDTLMVYDPVNGCVKGNFLKIPTPQSMKVQRIHPKAKLPTKAYDTPAGYDLYCVAEEDWLEDEDGGQSFILRSGNSKIFRTGIKLALPETPFVLGGVMCYWQLLLWDKSGLGAKHKIHRLAGVIDNDYRGEILVCLSNMSNKSFPAIIKEGQAIVQAVPTPVPHFPVEEVEELNETERGQQGFGSSS